MLRRSLVSVMFLLMVGTALAADEKDVKISGYIIDNACASAHASELTTYVKGHPTACATMPNCMKSGYSVVSDGKQYKLDEDSNKKIAAMLKGAKSKKGLAVTIEGELKGDTLHIKKVTESES